MEAPKCRICGHAHWMRWPHIWDDEPKRSKIAELKEETCRRDMRECVTSLRVMG